MQSFKTKSLQVRKKHNKSIKFNKNVLIENQIT